MVRKLSIKLLNSKKGYDQVDRKIYLKIEGRSGRKSTEGHIIVPEF